MNYTVSDEIEGQDVIRAVVEAGSPLEAVARYVDKNLPPEELVVYRGGVMGKTAVLKTTHHKIMAMAVTMKVAEAA